MIITQAIYIKFPSWLTPGQLLSGENRDLKIAKSKEILEETEPAEIKVDKFMDGLQAWWRKYALP